MPMSRPNEKLVDFNKYCKDCKDFDKEEAEDPCYDCLNNPANMGSHKTVRFTPKKKKDE